MQHLATTKTGTKLNSITTGSITMSYDRDR